MSTEKRKKSVFGAWDLFRNGDWVFLKTLRDHCGDQGDRRARSLRSEEYGGFTLEVDRSHPSGTRYRIPIDEIKSKPKVVALLDAGKRVTTISPVDKVRNLQLEVTDIVYIIAHLVGDAKLSNERVKKLWSERRSQLLGYLYSFLPDCTQYTYELFEKDENASND